MIVSIAGVILSIILLLCFINIRWGTVLFLVYSLLIPIASITIGTLHIGDNVVKTTLVLSLIYNFKLKHNYKFSWKLLMPFVVYFIIEILIIPFQSETPMGSMLNSWRFDVMSTLFGAFVVYNVLSVYPGSIKIFRYTLLASIFVASAYGLFLTTTGGINPYILEIVSETGSTLKAQDLTHYFSDESRLFGRISSVFLHPMNFGLFIGLAFIYVYSIRNKTSKWIFVILLSILAIDSIVCGVRSCIGGLVVTVAYYLVFSKNLKIGITALVIGLIGYNVILQMPELSSYLGSITDIQGTNSDVQGSSIELRLDQLNGCFKEIKNSPILGKGYGWVSFYKTNFGDHPVILSFESLIFVILCNNGFLGFVIWGLLIFAVFRNNHKFQRSESILADSLLFFYIAYSCITGEYGYMQYYLLFYICLVFDSSKTNINYKVNVKCKSNSVINQ